MLRTLLGHLAGLTIAAFGCHRQAFINDAGVTEPPVTAETVSVFVGSHSEARIAHLSLHLGSGLLTKLGDIAAAPNPRVLAWNSTKGILYAGNDRSGRISSWRLSGPGGAVSPAADVPSSRPGVWPVSLALHPAGRWLLVGHYENDQSGPLSVVQLDPSGIPTETVFVPDDWCDDTGSFRVAFDPSGQFAFAVCDDDGVYGYRFDEMTGRLDRIQYSSPLDHADYLGILFGPRKDVVYFFDGGLMLSVLNYSGETGTPSLPPKGVFSFAVPGEELPYPRVPFTSRPWLVPNVVAACCDRLFAVNTYQNAVASISLASDAGVAATKTFRTAGLRRPVHLTPTADGARLLVANEETGSVMVLTVHTNGDLEELGPPVVAIPGAASVVIAEGRP
jgi:6-phosphogluconolactonase (cycloisomerase 2 family)